MRDLAARLAECGGTLVVAGDTKGPDAYVLRNSRFVSIADQNQSGFRLADTLPTKHYARKNIAYLEAIRLGATCLYETDDDNRPIHDWKVRDEVVTDYRCVIRENQWVNVYQYFSNDVIWPRGLPLKEVRRPAPKIEVAFVPVRCPIQQGLVNNSPDVDAIWRLTQDRPFDFDPGKLSVLLPPGAWCPFNTQSTWWWPIAFPLLYIPSYCSFRMCDIWKSFIAQRCLWQLGMGVAFHAAEVIQDRNEHDLSQDFESEIPGYLRNQEIIEILEKCDLMVGEEYIADNLYRCYTALVDKAIFPEKELDLVRRWLADVEMARS